MENEIKQIRIKCYKYKYSVDMQASVDSRCEIQPALIEFSEDGLSLKINNILIKENIDYLLDADPNIVEAKRKEHQQQKAQTMDRLNTTFEPTIYDSFGDLPGLGQEESDYENDPDITCTIQESSATCLISDIQTITFGAFTSRFWALRKHINSLHDDLIDKLPFYSWQCISLTLKTREVDLVFKNQRQMNKFVKYIIYKMHTIDGKKDTALAIL